MSYETSVRRLEEIVSILTNGTKPLAESLALFEEGVGLVRAADAALGAIETRAKELMNDAVSSSEE